MLHRQRRTHDLDIDPEMPLLWALREPRSHRQQVRLRHRGHGGSEGHLPRRGDGAGPSGYATGSSRPRRPSLPGPSETACNALPEAVHARLPSGGVTHTGAPHPRRARATLKPADNRLLNGAVPCCVAWTPSPPPSTPPSSKPAAGCASTSLPPTWGASASAWKTTWGGCVVAANPGRPTAPDVAARRHRGRAARLSTADGLTDPRRRNWGHSADMKVKDPGR